jgi:hypothetical protein
MTMYVGYEVMLAVVTYNISIILNVGVISKFVNESNDVNTVYVVLLVGLDQFVIVGNLYIMFEITLNVLGFVLYMFGVEGHYIDMSSYLLLFCLCLSVHQAIVIVYECMEFG